MSTNLDELDPSSPEYEAEMERRQEEEDAANGNVEGKPADSDEGEEPTEAAKAVSDTEPEAAAAPAEPPKVAGIASKDGSRVLPYSALQAERRAARHERAERERAQAEAAALRQQIEDLKAGKTAEPADTDDLSEAELEAVAQDFPQVAKVAKKVKALEAQLSKLSTVAEAEPQHQEPDDDPVQEAIDAVPMLLQWQHSDAEKFSRAQAIDSVLKGSPKWRTRPMQERFEEVARQVADEFDIQTEEQPQSTKTPPRKASAQEVASRATRATPNTLSDIKGGAAPEVDNLARLSPQQLQARMAKWSDEEIDAYLMKHGG